MPTCSRSATAFAAISARKGRSAGRTAVACVWVFSAMTTGCPSSATTPEPTDTGDVEPTDTAIDNPDVAPVVDATPHLVVTTSAAPFARNTVNEAAYAAGDKADVIVTTSKEKQVIDGFGGAFNEQGWDALASLTDEARDEVLRAVFDPTTGLRFNYSRTPIGASDYATDRYTLDETPDDFAMEHFSIERDRKKLIPYIKAAMRFRPDLKLWASAWTPPTWMKTTGTFDRGAMKDDPKVYGAYALYLAKFVEAYRAEGLDVVMVVPQNEPGQLTDYPSCDWLPAQMRTFVRDHAGPLFAQRKLPAELWFGTINKSSYDVRLTMDDAEAARYVGGICLQWDGLNQLRSLRAAYPNVKFMQSETDCGNHYWEAGYNATKAPNDHAYAAFTWRMMRDSFNNGVSSYMLWNIVLDQSGKNIDAKSPWPQNSAIVIDTTTKTVTYTPMFWATKHFSAHVDVGAKFLTTSSTNVLSFKNPNGTVVVQLLNDGTAAWSPKVALADEQRVFALNLPPKSFATLVVPAK